MKKSIRSIDLLELKPKRNLEWETREEGVVTLLVPKFRNRYLVKWFVPLLAKPTMRVKLDKFGSYVWQRCDGEATVGTIGKEMASAFGESPESLLDRVTQFVQKLARNGFVRLNTIRGDSYVEPD